MKPETIKIDDVEYVRKDSVSEKADGLDGMPFQIVRCDRAGVFAGHVQSQKGQEVVIRKARRIWYWTGAASLSQLAMEGTKKPGDCKFPCAVDRVQVLDAIEILDITAAAKKSIDGVAVWKQ